MEVSPWMKKITENRSDFQSQLFQSCIKICHYQGPLSIPSYEYSTSPITWMQHKYKQFDLLLF